MDQVDDILNEHSPAPEPLPERRFIEDKSRAEIVRLFNKFKESAQRADLNRAVFVEFINMVRQQMGIPVNELWDIADDASYFEKKQLPLIPPERVDNAQKVASHVPCQEDSSASS